MMSPNIIVLMLVDIEIGSGIRRLLGRPTDTQRRTPMPDVTTGRTPAYSITEVVEVLDPEGAQRYAELTPIAVDKFGGRFVVLGALPTVAEGEAGVAVAVVEWPDMETL